MTPQQARKFKKLCKEMSNLLSDMEREHPKIYLFIDDGTPYLIDGDKEGERGIRDGVICNGAYWHRSGGGGF